MCLKSYRDRSHLKDHITKVHIKEKPFECEICRKSFGYKQQMQLHIKCVHGNEKPFKCEICFRNFGRRTNLKKHIAVVHYKQYKCNKWKFEVLKIWSSQNLKMKQGLKSLDLYSFWRYPTLHNFGKIRRFILTPLKVKHISRIWNKDKHLNVKIATIVFGKSHL